MTTWYKEGVIGDLNPGARRAKKIVQQIFEKKTKDLFITSKRDGNHGHGSCHPEGDAFDFLKVKGVNKNMIEIKLGADYDVVEHSTHFHVEYDPKR